jgi:hypothetical protein
MNIVYRQHAVRRMFDREISADDVLSVLLDGKTIESYPNDTPYPSRLMMGFRGQRPLHVVIADNLAEDMQIVITVYEPDSELWENDFTTRKGKP